MIELHRDFWKPLRHHAEQQRYIASRKRFKVTNAGRRSGKTDLAKREGVMEGIEFDAAPRGKFIFGAPTRDQAKRIYWEDLLSAIPRKLVRKVMHTDLEITICTSTRFCVVGMEEPERVEGEPADYVVLDEIDAMKADVWEKSVRPALSTPGRPPGRARFLGKPKGRKKLYELYMYALKSGDPEWDAFHWKSSEIIDPDEDASARRQLDPRSYAQEYDADFVNLEGRIYYPFATPIHASERLPYFDDQPIAFCFDFNVSPGIAEVVQEQRYWGRKAKVAGEITASIGEVWIRDDSNSELVCRALLQQFGKHKGDVYCYGDATGGARGSAKVAGSDWTIIERVLRPVFGRRLRMNVPLENPPEKVRVNAVNSRLLNSDGVARWLIDPVRCPKLIDDFESVQGKKDGSGEIDKDPDRFKWLTHVSDAVGYYVVKRHPITGPGYALGEY